MKNLTSYWVLAAIFTLCGAMTSCHKTPDNPESETIALDCTKPDYLKAGDTVALISPSYYTPMENV